MTQESEVPEVSRDRVVYLLREGQDTSGEALDLMKLSRAVWRGKWTLVLVTLLFAVLGVVYAVTADPWYRATVTMIPADQRSGSGMAGQLAQFGGLASLAGINISGGNKSEPLAVLRSREFALEFIEQKKLLQVLFADKWDKQRGQWSVDADKQPDLRDAVDMFDKKIRIASEDRKSGLTLLTVTWKDANLAAAWANELATRVNAKLRDRAQQDASADVAYLQKEMQNASQVSLQQAIGRLMEGQMEKLMLARGNEEFAFRVIDKAHVAKRPYSPKRRLVVIMSGLAGLLMGVLLVIGRALYTGSLSSGDSGNA